MDEARTLGAQCKARFRRPVDIPRFSANNDFTTTEYMARRLGKTRVAVTREGEVAPEQQQHGLTGRSEMTDLYDLSTPDEVSRLFARSDPFKRQLVNWAGYDPMILQRVEYFDRGSQHYPIFVEALTRA